MKAKTKAPSIVSLIKKAAKDVAELRGNMHETEVGGGTPLPVGPCLATLIGYIELGDRPLSPKAKPGTNATKDAFSLAFAIQPLKAKAKNKDDYYHDGVPRVVYTYPQKISRQEKSNHSKWARTMDPDGTAGSFPGLIGRTYISAMKESKDGKYVNLDMDIIRPAVDDRTDEPIDPPVAFPEDQYQLFLWNDPTEEMWASLAYTDKEGNVQQGRMQRDILAATNFSGSPIEELLANGGVLEKELEEAHKVEEERQKRADNKNDAGDVEELAEEDDEEDTPPPPKKATGVKLPKVGKAKLPEPEEDDDDDFEDEEEEEEELPPPPPPKKKAPVKKALKITKKKPALPEPDEDDEDEDEE